MNKAIITGASGFIGKQLINELLSRNIKFTSFIKEYVNFAKKKRALVRTLTTVYHNTDIPPDEVLDR